MAEQNVVFPPPPLPRAPRMELLYSTLLDSVVTKYSPITGSHPARYGAQVEPIITPRSAASERICRLFS